MGYKPISSFSIYTGCPTSERQPGGKVFGVTIKVLSNSKHTLLLPFSAVTEKPSGNPKDTLLLSRESKNPSANGLEFVLIFRLPKHRFPMPKLPKRKTGIRSVISPNLN